MSLSRIAQLLAISAIAALEGTAEAPTRRHDRTRPHDQDAAEAIRAERLARKRAAFEKRQPSNTTPKGTP